jgi:hypothetical protein
MPEFHLQTLLSKVLIVKKGESIMNTSFNSPPLYRRQNQTTQTCAQGHHASPNVAVQASHREAAVRKPTCKEAAIEVVTCKEAAVRVKTS